jgi:hypothetical protein
MKTRAQLLAAVLLLVVAPAFAQATFPGLKSVLTEAEWKRAGLDRLTPDQLGVIDAALIKREAGLTAQHQAAVTAATQTAATEKPAPGTPAGFGLPDNDGSGWQNIPPLKAKVVKWETPNRFRLDNNQAWESDEPIVYDLVGKEVEIQARPHNRFTLVVDGANTNLRISRVR